MPQWELIGGDCIAAMVDLALDGQVFQSVVTDPPYHLQSIVKRFGKPGSAAAKSNGPTGVYSRVSAGFMGQQWDGGDIAFDRHTWELCWELLPPGGHLVAFGGSRTYHRMACAIEDAGFQIRDQIMWLYGSGLPKSHNQKGDWIGWGTGLKPAHEPIVLARKPLGQTVKDCLREHGTGALNIDATRVQMSDADRSYIEERIGGFNKTQSIGGKTAYGGGRVMDRAEAYDGSKGRWPANVCHDGSDEVEEAFAVFGKTGAIAQVKERRADKFRNTYHAFKGNRAERSTVYDELGSASRFFYCAKASKAERRGSKHPTVKPLALMRWLVRMVTPPGGRVLDPFAGTGTTGAAAWLEGFDSVLIEAEPDYQKDIRDRMVWLDEGLQAA